ncbi:MAG: inverse autotransporter beta domain-containing protein [Veillonella sp.]|nr:inverse autotransporter beta domain-containing protein [Veillonella sp.]
MYRKTKFNIRLLLCVTACTMCWPIALAESADKDNALQVVDTGVHQSWDDRTDISAEFQTNHNPIYGIETLQPIKYYDNNSKSVVFIQGKVSSRGGVNQIANGYANHATRNAGGIGYGYDFNQSTQSISTTGSIGLGYRRLSKGEHSYVGINTFYDYAFKEHYKRTSLGVEYVTGENEIYANFYKPLGHTTSSHSSTWRDEMIPAPYNTLDTEVLVGESHEKRIASGYDIGYGRTFKNARYLRAYIDRYHWNHMNGEIRDIEWFSDDIDNIAFPVNGTYNNGFKMGVNVNVSPHISVGLGYDKPFGHSGEFYAQTMYTLGKSKFALFGGKHSDGSMTTARSKMLDKIERQDMQALNLNGDFHVHYPHDHL